MPVRIRLAQRGKKKNRTFRVIVADSRSPRDGKFIEDLGYYDPHHNPSMVVIDVDKAVTFSSSESATSTFTDLVSSTI